MIKISDLVIIWVCTCKLSLCTTPQRSCRSRILNLGSTVSSTHWIRGLTGLRADTDSLGNLPGIEQFHGRPARRLVATRTKPSQLLLICSTSTINQPQGQLMGKIATKITSESVWHKKLCNNSLYTFVHVNVFPQSLTIFSTLLATSFNSIYSLRGKPDWCLQYVKMKSNEKRKLAKQAFTKSIYNSNSRWNFIVLMVSFI